MKHYIKRLKQKIAIFLIRCIFKTNRHIRRYYNETNKQYRKIKKSQNQPKCVTII